MACAGGGYQQHAGAAAGYSGQAHKQDKEVRRWPALTLHSRSYSIHELEASSVLIRQVKDLLKAGVMEVSAHGLRHIMSCAH